MIQCFDECIFLILPFPNKYLMIFNCFGDVWDTHTRHIKIPNNFLFLIQTYAIYHSIELRKFLVVLIRLDVLFRKDSVYTYAKLTLNIQTVWAWLKPLDKRKVLRKNGCWFVLFSMAFLNKFMSIFSVLIFGLLVQRFRFFYFCRFRIQEVFCARPDCVKLYNRQE